MADAAHVERVVRDAYAKYVARIGREPAPMRDDYVLRIREGGAWVMTLGSKIIGVLVMQFKSRHALLHNVAVAPEYQRAGNGTLLAAFAEKEAKRRAYHEIRLYTNEAMTENIALYGRLGYAEIFRGEHEGYRRVFMRKML